MTQPDRSRFLGSSDMAALMGVSPWSTPLDVYMQKTSAERAEVSADKEKLFKRGKRLEPVVVEMLEDERGLDIVARNKRYTDPEHAFLSCEVDAETEIDGERVNIECKTAHHFTAWKYGEEDTDEIPVEYAAQAMFSLMVTGRRRCIFGVLFGMDNLVTYQIERDEETIAAMRATAVSFWNDNVLARVPPPPKNFDDCTLLFPRERSTIIQADEQMRLMVQAYRKTNDSVAFYEDAAELLKFQIAEAMLGAAAIDKKDKPGKHVLMDGSRELLTVSLQEQERVDTAKLKDLYPAVVKAVGKTSKFFTVRLSRKKQ